MDKMLDFTRVRIKSPHMTLQAAIPSTSQSSSYPSNPGWVSC